MWLCNDPLLIDKQCGTLSCFVAYMIINDVALDELAIRQRDCYSMWVSKSNSAARVDTPVPFTTSSRGLTDLDRLSLKSLPEVLVISDILGSVRLTMDR